MGASQTAEGLGFDLDDAVAAAGEGVDGSAVGGDVAEGEAVGGGFEMRESVDFFGERAALRLGDFEVVEVCSAGA